MRKKFGTLLDAQLIQRIKLEATKEGAPLNELLERALWNYLEIGKSQQAGKSSFTERTKGILRIPKKTLQGIFREDLYDA